MDNELKISKSQRILLDLTRKIREGEFGPGTMLPSENTLAATYGVGRNTLRKALAALTEQRLLSKSQGRTSRVVRPAAAPPVLPGTAECMAWLSAVPHAALSHNTLYFDFFRYMVSLAAEHRIRIDFLSTSDPYWFDMYLANHYSGAFITGGWKQNFSQLDYVRLRSIRNLITLDDTSDHLGHFCISTDNSESTRIGTRYLLDSGRRKIAFFGSIAQNAPIFPPFIERRRGYEIAHEEVGLPLNPDAVHFVRVHSLNFLLSELREYAELLTRYDAVFCATDLLAVLLVQLAKELRIDVPGKLAVVGFDGWSVAQYLFPRLTTLRHPVEDIVHTAFNLALRLRTNPDLPGQNIRLPGVLIVGETTTPPPAFGMTDSHC